MPAIVCDTSSLVSLSKAGTLKHLNTLFSTVHIPNQVWKECNESQYEPLDFSGFSRYSVVNVLPVGLGAGERDVISAAVELRVSIILADDKKAIAKAREFSLLPLQTVNVLLLMKEEDIISSVKDALDKMIANGEGIEYNVYTQIVLSAGESF